MNYEAISGYVRTRPFVPFALHLRDGGIVMIDDPKYTSWTPDRRRFVFNDFGSHLLYLDLDTIARIEPSGLEKSIP